jgi:two-component system, NarL family, nitrate/nitrite response regulator NarL
MRVAIVDDHELVCAGLSALIDGHTDISLTYAGASPSQAAQTRADVVLLDVDLGPSTPGVVEHVRLLQEAGANVLLISAYEEAPSIRLALKEGALGFIPKRVSVEVLIDALQSVARGEMYLSVDLASILANAPEAPGLSPRERDALSLYASGLKLTAVAHRMGISPHTAKEYLDRVRAKYEAVGRHARTRTELYAEAQRDGFIPQLDR